MNTNWKHTTLVFLTFAIMGGGTSPAVSADRLHWRGSQIQGTPDPPPPYRVERIYPGLQLQQPTHLTTIPGSERWIATELKGTIVAFDHEADSTETVEVFDLQEANPASTQCFGIAFHPEYPREPYVFLTYEQNPKSDHGVRLCRFRVSDTARPTIDPRSELVLASWRSYGHRGGCLEFGPDGYLYVGIGDGNPPSPPDPLGTGQDIRDLQSSILRIDVRQSSPQQPYQIPPDNPFVKHPEARGEVWAYGFRNPWKFSFDPRSKSLWTGDVGWEYMEMVYRVEKGGNYGWSVMEGTHSVQPEAPVGPTPIQPPVVEYTHVEGRSVTGGHFLYSSRLPELNGTYIYGDWMTGKIWGLRHDGQKLTWHKELADSPLQIIAFAAAPDGDLIVVGYGGTLHRLVPNPVAEQQSAFPRRLSETGLFTSTADHQPAPGVIAYELNAYHWADHTTSEQFLGLVGDSQIGVYAADEWTTGQVQGHFDFPADAVLAKTVFLEMEAGNPASRRRVETQILHRYQDTWNGYNYIWNDQQTDAELQDDVALDRQFEVIDPRAPGGKRQQVWHHASRSECLLCHVWAAGTVHGFKLAQLNRPARGADNQLVELQRQQIFRQPLPEPLTKQTSPYDPHQPLDRRARAWLHLNCAHCHSFSGGGTATFNLLQDLPWSETKLADSSVTQGTFGLQDARVLAPGDPYRSVLYYRIMTTGHGHMPKFGSSLIDNDGVHLIHDWIDTLQPEDGSSAPSQPTVLALGAQPATDASAVKQTLSSTNGALQLVAQLQDGSLSPQSAQLVVEHGSQHTDAAIRDLFERFLPPDQRVARLGTPTSEEIDQLLKQSGDPERGRQIWFESSGVACRNCHPLRSQGTSIGPDLGGVGRKYAPRELLENILSPSKKVDSQFATWVAQTQRGTVHTGLLVADTADQIIIREAAGKDIPLKRAELDELLLLPRSIMPEHLLRDFTTEQAADLLAFLAQQTAEPGKPKLHPIPFTQSTIEVDGRLDESAWKQASSVGDFEFTWLLEGQGPRQQTEAKLLWDQQQLYVAWRCTDRDVQATRTVRDSDVYRDDCVEIFVSPFHDQPERYLNLEINARGTFLDNFRPEGVAPAEPWNASGIQIAAAIDGTLNNSDDADRGWTVEAAIPFAVFSEATGFRRPQPGDRWRLNLHRLEDNMRIKSQWSRGDPARSSFHMPAFFGIVTFEGGPRKWAK